MDNVKQKIIQSSLGSVFTTFAKSDLEKTKETSNTYIAVSGKIMKPGIYEINEDTTIEDVIEMAGGIINKRPFKAAHIGCPFGTFYLPENLHDKINLNLFEDNSYKQIIIMSDEECIVQYCIYNIGSLLGSMKEGEFQNCLEIETEIKRIARIFDRISKGKANLRDIYLLRQLAKTMEEKLKLKNNVVLEVISDFYGELEEHIEDRDCATGQCPQLAQLTITEKCVGCGACKRVCPVDCIEGSLKVRHRIDHNKCTHCGQCIQACPVNAITEGDNTYRFLRDLSTPNKIVITQMAPAVRVAIGEAFGFESGENVEKKVNAALKMLGVKYVFDTTWAADLTIMEEAAELQERIEAHLKGDENVKFPLLTSCCPAWVKFIEQSYPDMLDVPSSAKSPMQMFATIAKDIWAKENGYSRDEVTSVAIMPCVAKKYEAAREEFSRGDNYDTDYVITTKELIRILKETEIDLSKLEDEDFDNPLGIYSGAGIIFGRTGGVIEAAARTAIEKITGKRIDNIEFTALRGWDGFRSCTLNVAGMELKIGVAFGLKEAGKMLDKIRSGEEFYHAIEIMACEGGCIGGGGQPKVMRNKKDVIIKRGEGLNKIDRSLPIRRSHENPSVLEIYDKYLDKPLSRKAHELIHTKYFPKFNK